jgi:hypothetical protein
MDQAGWLENSYGLGCMAGKHISAEKTLRKVAGQSISMV